LRKMVWNSIRHYIHPGGAKRGWKVFKFIADSTWFEFVCQ
jgi:hypothetical protein